MGRPSISVIWVYPILKYFGGGEGIPRQRRVRLWRRTVIGGRGGIRTHGALSSSTVFKTVLFNRSSTLPKF